MSLYAIYLYVFLPSQCCDAIPQPDFIPVLLKYSNIYASLLFLSSFMMRYALPGQRWWSEDYQGRRPKGTLFFMLIGKMCVM